MGVKKPGIFEANLIYLILGITLLIIGYLVQSREIYSGLLITEYVLILLPNIIYLKARGYKLKDVLKLNPIGIKQIIIIILSMIFAYPIAIFLNAIFLAIINSFSSAMPTSVPIPTNSFEFLISMFIIAISPGICEEIMFRGTMFSAYEKLGHKKTIIITAILFGVFHFNILNFIGPAFLGVILGILVHKTNSIFSSILGHTLNNGIALTIGYFITKYSNEIDELAATSTNLTDSKQLLISILSLGFIALLSGVMLVVLLKSLSSNESNFDEFSISELSFIPERYRVVKYFPLVIVFITFIFLNYRMLFYV
ncbi:type II CAAX endopeptidase family protein [Tissierella sp. Yu-01]|uniref:type II CAAX endopeptidase family protein n=1 Tax=Tissierella sp. Yu-01 TaxID=3035694 RepID=UPI00240D8076|nr:type II CAAX endopeptidase family protein [Tissierella sp. Yu-01]WFA09894.1 type II CAAX endopeptidase family protein [Tissierella sp. Yu-01]